MNLRTAFIPPAFAGVCAIAVAALPAAAQQSATPAALPAGVVATVNGIPIRQALITDRLWRERGPVYTDYRVKQEIIREEARKRGLSVSPDELKDRLELYRAQFIAAPGHQPRDWDDLLRRFGLKNIEQQQSDDLLQQKISEQEAANTVLTPEESRHVVDDLVRAAHTVHIRHILVGYGPQYFGRTEADARTRADEVQAKLKAGAKWEDLVTQYTDDLSTRDLGGDLGFVTRDQLDKTLEDAAFAATPSPTEVHVAPVDSALDIFQVLERKDSDPTNAQKQAALAETLQRKKELDRQVVTWFPKIAPNYTVITLMPFDGKSPVPPVTLPAAPTTKSRTTSRR